MKSKLRVTVERRTLAEQIYTSLKQAIVKGDLRPGERLKEIELAQTLGASRTPVREALSWLERERLVTPVAFVGLIVSELSESDVRDIFGLLRVLESYGARLAADHITPAQLNKLEANCTRADEFARKGDDRISDLNWDFHELLVESSGNKRLQEMVHSLRASMRPYRAVMLNSSQFREHSVEDHRELVALLRAKNHDKLEQLMAHHLEEAEEVTLQGLQERARRLALGESV
jgi:DNA-binding GntR family transcriptional regulator